VKMRAAVAALGSALAVGANAQTMACSTSSQGYTVCLDEHGRRVTGWTWDSMTLWQENQAPVQPDTDLVVRPRTDQGTGK
jgi:hypothetical protein